MYLVEYQFFYHFRSNCITSRNASKGDLTDVMHLDRFDCSKLDRFKSVVVQVNSTRGWVIRGENFHLLQGINANYKLQILAYSDPWLPYPQLGGDKHLELLLFHHFGTDFMPLLKLDNKTTRWYGHNEGRAGMMQGHAGWMQDEHNEPRSCRMKAGRAGYG